MICKHCGGNLVPIGLARKNGKSHYDWDAREYHKKCWIRMLVIKKMDLYIQEILKKREDIDDNHNLKFYLHNLYLFFF